MRINREPALDEMARAFSYGGVRSGRLRDKMAEISNKHGSHAVAMAFTELTMTDPATNLTVLRPHVRPLCKQFMGPPPEDPGYVAYWSERGREPPPEHRPPVDAPAAAEAPQEDAVPTPPSPPRPLRLPQQAPDTSRATTPWRPSSGWKAGYMTRKKSPSIPTPRTRCVCWPARCWKERRGGTTPRKRGFRRCRKTRPLMCRTRIS
jgi:hypothetical protein